MLGINHVTRPRLLSPLAGSKPVLISVGTFVLLAVAWYVGQVVVLDHSASAAVNTSVARASAPLRPDQPIQITIAGAGVQLDERLQLFRADLADDGSRGAEQPVPIRLEPVGDGTAANWQVTSADGSPLLRPDGAYRLAVRVAAPRPALPMPRTELVEQQYRFTTVPSPRLNVPADGLSSLKPRWAEPVSVVWSAPMSSVEATVQPVAPLKTWIDTTDASRTWIQVGAADGAGLTDGQTYEVSIVNARATDGITLQRPASLKVDIPRRPRFDPPPQPVRLRFGEAVTLKSSIELTGAQATTTLDSARVAVGSDAVRVDLPTYEQGVEFDVDVLSATSVEDAPLAQPLRIHVVTPPAFETPAIAPVDGSLGFALTGRPAVTFAEPVADQAAATRALQIEPPVAGHWSWASDSRVEFVPDERLPILTALTLTVRGGPDGPRTATSAYLEDDLSSTFRTTDFRRMDVSLSTQTMTLYENDVAWRTINVATGVAGAPTPTGTFYVQSKSSQMRFRGVNPDGSRYDIPDVHWVMPFLGDYTIHGAYWRARFGIPGSAGCVSMTDADAKILFGWADVGTPIVVHR